MSRSPAAAHAAHAADTAEAGARAPLPRAAALAARARRRRGTAPLAASLGAAAALTLRLASTLTLTLASLTTSRPAAAQAVAPRVVARTYPAMGTDLTLTAYVADPARAEAAFTAAYAEVKRLEALMTDWEWPGQPPSDVVRVNAAAGQRQPVTVAPETMEVIVAAQEMAEKSNGAFDITYAVMRGLWRFDEDLEKRIPAAAEIARRRRLINWRDLVVDRAARTVRLRRKGMRIGLGGIAKGYAVDHAAAVLRAQGLGDFMVQAGGDLYVSGSKGGASWMVGVRDPRGGPRDIIGRMPIRDHAFSTAGDYERSFILDGRRYHHIIDPKTGYPAAASRGVTVLAPTAFIADAIDDAIFILGPKKGLALCARFPDTAALVIDADNKVWTSPSLAKTLERTGEPKDGV